MIAGMAPLVDMERRAANGSLPSGMLPRMEQMQRERDAGRD